MSLLFDEVVGFERPFGVRALSDGSFYIVDIKTNLLTYVGKNLKFVWATSGDAKLNGPHSIAVAPDGAILVTEFYGRCVRRFLPDGTDAGFFAMPTLIRPWLLSGPAGIEIFPDGAVIVADYGNHCLLRFSPDGFFDAWHDGRKGWMVNGIPSGLSSHEGFDRVHAAISLPDERMLVVDTWNHRLRFFDRKGQSESILNEAMPTFNTPVSVTTLDDSFIISEYGNNCLRRFNYDCRLLGWLGMSLNKTDTLGVDWRLDDILSIPSNKLGGFHHPYDVKSYAAGLIVADTDNGRIQRITTKLISV